MQITLKDIVIHYEEYLGHKKDVILLHGWGQNTEMMAPIAESLKEHFSVYNIDCPGFGKSEEPKEVYGVEDYMELIHDFVIKKGITDPIFVCHSFGCRIALRYAYKYGAHKLALTGPAGVRDSRSISWYLKTYSYKLGKKIAKLLGKDISALANKAGSEDYRNSSGIMRGTFVKVVNDDVKPILKDIKTETLLIIGSNDTATPVSKGRIMEKLMPDCTMVIFENDDHYAYFHQIVRFNAVLDAFLRSDYD